MNQAVVLVTHFMDEMIAYKAKRMQEECRSVADFYLQMNTNDDLQTVNGFGYAPIYETLIPGSAHFEHLKFFFDHTNYQYYWFIEYDVEFTGSWRTLIDAFSSHDSDFLSSGIERYDKDKNGGWIWWHERNCVGYDLQCNLRSFNPICRYSSVAMSCLDRYMKHGHSAHSEVMIPTALFQKGLQLRDLGKGGEFSDSECEDFYTLSSGERSMRYRPVFTRLEFAFKREENKLYHPVKDFTIGNE